MHLGAFSRYSPVVNRFGYSDVYEQFCKEYQHAPPSGHGLAALSYKALYKAISKYNGPTIDLSAEELEDLRIATQWAQKLLKTSLWTDKLYSLDEVIDRVDNQKSPGFPWNQKYPTSAAVLDNHREYIDTYIEQVFSGGTPLTLWNYFPKEEILPSDKIDAGKLRQISGCAVEFKMLTNMVFLRQNERLTESHGQTWSEIGISPYGLGWAKLHARLASIQQRDTSGRSPKGFSLDVSRFDAAFSYAVAQCVKEVRLSAFAPELKTPELLHVVDYIYENIFRGYGVAPRGEVLVKEHGNNSGAANTAADNTIANIIAFLFCWVQQCRRRNRLPVYSEAIDNMEAAIYGDDNTATLTQFAQEFLYLYCGDGGNALEFGFGTLGWGVTFESAGIEPLDNLTFLSKKFKRVGPYITFEPIDGNKALCSLAYKSKGGPDVAYVRACGLLLTYWNCDHVRKHLEAYLDWLERTYFYDLGDSRTASLRSNRLAPHDMEQLLFHKDVKLRVEPARMG